MDDLIKRQAAIDAVYKCTDYYVGNLPVMIDKADAYKALADLPAADASPQWIPCSERLPTDTGTVLITHRGGVSFGWYNGKYWERGANTNHRPLQTVKAWMPMPEPWKGEER